MSIPSQIGIPAEMKLGEIDFSLPPDARSYAVKVMASNVQSVASPPISIISAGAGAPTATPQFVAQNIYFDLPCGQSPSTFLDTRFSTITFRATLTCSVNGAGSTVTTANLRGGAYSFFDRAFITAGSGQVLEDIAEYGLVYDTLAGLQLAPSVRDSLAMSYGFLSDNNNIGNQGHAWSALTARAPTTADIETHSYSFPMLSGLLGMGADKFLNIGRLNKLQFALQTATELPITIANAGAMTAGTITITLSDIALNLEYVDIGASAIQMLDSTLVDGNAYIHGTTYRTSAVSMPSVVGNQSLLAGVRGSSVKSLFARFVDGGAINTTNSVNSKYDSKNPNATSLNFNIGGLKFPNAPVNPLIAPASAFRATQMAIGSFNNSSFNSSLVPLYYCKLSAGGTASGTTLGGTQDANYTIGSVATALSQFIYGENLEVVSKRGLMSGLSCVNAPVFLEMNISTAPTNLHQIYITGMLDAVYIHNVRTGDIQVRM